MIELLAVSAENVSAADDLFDLGDLGDLDAFESPAGNSASNENEVLENSSDENQVAPEASEESDPTPAEESALFDSLPDFEQGDALSFDGQNLDDNAAPENEPSSEAQSADSENANSASDSNDGFDLGDFDDLGDFSSQEDSAQNESGISENSADENQDAPAESEEQSATPSEKSASSNDDFDLSDLGIDGIEIEDYSPASSTADSAEINVNSILGDEVASVDSEDELPEKKGVFLISIVTSYLK